MMRALSAQDVVELWEGGSQLGNGSRALAILDRVDPGANPDLKASERDERLLAVRALTFGAPIEVLAPCPACGEDVEVSFRAEDLGFGEGAPGWEPVIRVIQGHQVVLRPLTAGDLAYVEHERDLDAVRDILCARCVISIDGEENALIPPQLRADVERALEALDGRAWLSLRTHCPACDEVWELEFDPPGYVWAEIEGHAPRLLDEVATLARQYHWSEQEILAMSAARRRFYLEASA